LHQQISLDLHDGRWCGPHEEHHEVIA
jgi:hypothetical protein